MATKCKDCMNCRMKLRVIDGEFKFALANWKGRAYCAEGHWPSDAALKLVQRPQFRFNDPGCISFTPDA